MTIATDYIHDLLQYTMELCKEGSQTSSYNLFVQTMIVLQRVMQFDSTKLDLTFNNIHNNYYICMG